MGEVKTGFKDMRGVEIFKGDIVLRHRNSDPVVEEVKFEGSWVLEGKDGLKSLELFFGYVEVIGNIYGTPELLEQ